jgi:ParB-like chromosome segregation protein Spo0J
MTTHFIETLEQFLAVRDTIKPVFITSKRYGKIPVPCANTLLVARALIVANNYNPNAVSKDKMKLLRRSIRDNGFCFPIVAIFDEATQKFVIVDGFHRNSMGQPDWMDLDYIPVVLVDHDITKRMFATVQFNKARGVHQVDLDADLIKALLEQGNTEEEICTHLGIDLDTVHRYKSLTGIAGLFAKAAYSPSWNATEVPVEASHV